MEAQLQVLQKLLELIFHDGKDYLLQLHYIRKAWIKISIAANTFVL